MSISTKTAGDSNRALRWTVIVGFAALAFFASYRFAVASTTTSASAASAASATGTPLAGGTGTAAPAAGRGGCCGGGAATPVAGGGGCCGGGAGAPAGSQKTVAAAIAAGVQKITVDTTKGYYNPATIQLKAGVPAEITFTQSSGCLSQVQSQDLGFSEDLTGGPKTIKLGALKAGTYGFACGMNMQSGSIVVK